jgi:hypothetical protein
MGAARLSVVVVAHDMGRELPRTLRSLDVDYQRGVEGADYEVIVVDNGSAEAVVVESPPGIGPARRAIRLDPAPASPAHGANVGIEAASGHLVGLIVDGARLASPGLLATALAASRLGERTVIATLGWHLGPVRHMDAADAGYDQVAEDALLDGLAWEDDGYRLFEAATLGGSSAWGWFSPLAESSALFLAAPLWQELGGLDERFALPGGGLVNHDLYRRACELDGVQLVILLGEGTFHQIHGGSATSGRFSFEELQADYQAIRGDRYLAPTNVPIHLGHVPPVVEPLVVESVELARRYRERQRTRLR